MLVEVSIPLEAIGRVRCDYDGDYHVEVMGQEVDTDEETYWRVIKARASQSQYMRERMRELGIEMES